MRPDRFRLLATFIAGRSVEIAEAPAGKPAHTDGQVIFVTAGGSVAQQRREMLLQSALLGAGSLDQRLVKALRARPVVARRYLALEGRRVLAELASHMPLATALRPDEEPTTATAHESLEMARARTKVVDPPEWFGIIRPSRLLAPSAGPGAQATDKELRAELRPSVGPEVDDDAADQSGKSKLLKLFEHARRAPPVRAPPIPTAAALDSPSRWSARNASTSASNVSCTDPTYQVLHTYCTMRYRDAGIRISPREWCR